jgi:transposase
VNNPVPPELRICPRCGAEMTTVGHSRCEILSVIPAKVIVEVRLDETVACPNDDTIVSAPPPPAIVERGKLSDTLLVEATADKYLEHTPIERQCTRFARLGVEVAPQTLGRGVAAHLDLLAPQCDGTPTLSFLERAGGKRPGCWSHGRRRLVDAACGGDQLALEGLHKIARIFAVERASKLAGDTADERRLRRQRETRPVLDDLRAWLDDKRATIPPKTPLGRGLGYLHRQWKRPLLFLADGNLDATNNRLERELRRLIVGRKNWLFTWLDVGGERTATALTIIATCIAHDVNPRAYLHLVTRLLVHGWPQRQLRELLPDRIVTAHPALVASEPAALMPAGD